MKSTTPTIRLIAALLCLVLGAAVVYFWTGDVKEPEVAGALPKTVAKVVPPASEPSKPVARPIADTPVVPLRDDGEPALVDARELPPSRPAMSDADVLLKGGVLPRARKTGLNPVKPAPLPAPPVSLLPSVVAAPVPSPAPSQVENAPRSLKSEEWNGKVNQFVNALRAGRGLDMEHSQVMELLHGKNTFGWSESRRNWIGDELMIVMCHDMPERAFADLKTVQENTSAPAAMRDYSLQHISDLVSTNVIGKEGVEYVWQTLAQNDPATMSTALISLQRLSEDNPKLVSASSVAEAARKLLNHPDLRTQITAKSILKK